MKFNMICIKFDQRIKKQKKTKFWTIEVFKGFFKKPKNLGFFRSHFPALLRSNVCIFWAEI